MIKKTAESGFADDLSGLVWSNYSAESKITGGSAFFVCLLGWVHPAQVKRSFRPCRTGDGEDACVFPLGLWKEVSRLADNRRRSPSHRLSLSVEAARSLPTRGRNSCRSKTRRLSRHCGRAHGKTVKPLPSRSPTMGATFLLGNSMATSLSGMRRPAPAWELTEGICPRWCRLMKVRMDARF